MYSCEIVSMFPYHLAPACTCNKLLCWLFCIENVHGLCCLNALRLGYWKPYLDFSTSKGKRQVIILFLSIVKCVFCCVYYELSQTFLLIFCFCFTFCSLLKHTLEEYRWCCINWWLGCFVLHCTSLCPSQTNQVDYLKVLLS